MHLIIQFKKQFNKNVINHALHQYWNLSTIMQINSSLKHEHQPILQDTCHLRISKKLPEERTDKWMDRWDKQMDRETT